MKFKKMKLALVVTSTLFLSLPFSQAFAHQDHCDMKETPLGETMKHIKSELRAYVKGFKKDDQQKMQQHLNELLKLSEKANQYTPKKVTQMNHDGMKMDHSKMDMENMAEMDHSKMDMKDMAKMDHSKMDMKDMAKMDHSKMDMKDMPEMDHSQMDHGDMNMDSATHDMSTMPSMEGMTAEQHHQHMQYMQGMTKLQDLFKALDKTKDRAEIKTILGKIKEHSKKSHQQFRQDC